jgi:pyrophosphate--fructose-6-phosphate 1-phosphotransferase
MTTTSIHSLSGKHVNVALLTAGGLAPCLSSSVAQLIQAWIDAKDSNKVAGVSFRCYVGGYKGLLTGDSVVLPETEWASIDSLNHVGGSPIGNSRVKVRLIQCWMLLLLYCLYKRCCIRE